MTYPREYFAKRPAVRPGTCFIVMPFAADFASVHDTIVEALESSDVGFRCRRADEFFGGQKIMEDILREIATSELIVGDVTGRNPNVFYELGIAHMVKDPERVLLLTQHVEDIPFDLRAYRHIVYSRDERGLREFKTKLSTAAREVGGHIHRFSVADNGLYDTAPLFPGADRCLYSVHVSGVMPGFDFAKCMVRVDKHAVGQPVEVVCDSGLGFGKGEARHLCRELPWLLRLDEADRGSASFSIVPEGAREA